ncbi:MAG: UDP-N-acetylmuramate dehydrogenase [Deltaproteobacteria bacterium]|nr:UDP-N-acetylmuramate dehydrogenase [Deltaproteobacteria bacterium]
MISAAQKKELRRRLSGFLHEEVPLAPKTAYRAGGSAAFFVQPQSLTELSLALSTLAELELQFVVLGEGWNTLVADAGIRNQVVVSLGAGLDAVEVLGRDQWVVMLRVEAGVHLSRLLRLSAAEGFGGLEKMAGIPGSVGGAIAMNAGAYGTTVYDCLAGLELMAKGELQWLRSSRLKPLYRDGGLSPEQVVVAAYFLLECQAPEVVRETIAEIMKLRGRRLPPGAHAGSVFRNPVGDYAGRLLEESGCKGMRRGKAFVSAEHANVIVADDGVRATDIIDLIEEVRRRVQDRCGIRLETEIKIYS